MNALEILKLISVLSGLVSEVLVDGDVEEAIDISKIGEKYAIQALLLKKYVDKLEVGDGKGRGKKG